MQHTLKQFHLKWNLHTVFWAQEKSTGGIGGQTKHQAYVCMGYTWALAYQEVLAISKGYGETLKSVLTNTDANPLRKELRNNILEYSDITKE